MHGTYLGHRMRTHRAKIVALIAVLTITAIAVAVGAGARPRNSVNPRRIMLGTSMSWNNGETGMDAIARVEGQIGRKLGAVRVFVPWDGFNNFPSPFHTWLRDSDHKMYFSVKSLRTNGSIVQWADIARAQPGDRLYDDILTWANDIKGYGERIFFIFNHEPEAKVSDPMGTSAEYVAAWRHIVDIFRSQGVTNARYTWVMTDYAYHLVGTNDDRNADKWYPGDAYVDQIGSDPYNWYTCRGDKNATWRSLEGMVQAFKAFGAEHPDKFMVLAEFGSIEDPKDPGRKGRWLQEAVDLFRRPGYEMFRALLYFDSDDQTYGPCNWYLDSSQASVDAYRVVGSDVHFQRNMT